MHQRTALWGDALTPHEPGAVALISQSGNVAVNALATRRGLRFHTVVASGNQAVLSAADYLSFLAGEDGLGRDRAVPRGRRRPGAVRRTRRVRRRRCARGGVEGGQLGRGARAAAAHSAALAGDQRIFRALIEEAGAIWASDVHDLLELAKTLAVPRSRAGRGGGLAIMTCSGGDSAQGADEAQRLGLELPALSPATARAVRELLPSAATVANPLDYTAMIWGDGELLAELVRTRGRGPRARPGARVLRPVPGADGRGGGGVGRGPRRGHRRRRGEPGPTMICSTLPELLDDERPGSAPRRASPPSLGCALACVRGGAARRPGDPARLLEIAAVARGALRRRPRRQAGVAVRARRQGAAAWRRRRASSRAASWATRTLPWPRSASSAGTSR